MDKKNSRREEISNRSREVFGKARERRAFKEQRKLAFKKTTSSLKLLSGLVIGSAFIISIPFALVDLTIDAKKSFQGLTKKISNIRGVNQKKEDNISTEYDEDICSDPKLSAFDFNYLCTDGLGNRIDRNKNRPSKNNKRTEKLISPIAAQSEIDQKVHKMCLPAADYKGCVEAQKVGLFQNLSKTTKKKKLEPTSFENLVSNDFDLSIDQPYGDLAFRETFVHKGKTYTASRACKSPRRMVWTTYPSFLGIGGKVEEAGCMTPLELEAYNREQKLRRASRPVIINNPPPISPPSNRPMMIPMYRPPTTSIPTPYSPPPPQVPAYKPWGGYQNPYSNPY